jgi:SAM-dependent methyltransferase
MVRKEISGGHRGWWTQWFNEEYLDVYRHRDLDSAEAEARASVAWLGLHPSDAILDLCCGTGRHLSWLAAAGLSRVVGLDFSISMLREARHELGADVSLIRADMRFLPFQPCFDAVLVFFTSFGYFPNDRENEGVIQQIARVLRPGGGFLFDYLNSQKLQTDLEPETVRTVNGATVREVRCLVDDGKRVRKTISITREGVTRNYNECVRLYSAGELRAMFEAAAIRPDRSYGDFDGSPFTDKSDRLILVRLPRR